MNKSILQALQRAEKDNRLHHAYLLTGQVIQSKLETLREFALAIFVNGKDSPAALRFLRGGHPDFVEVEAEEGSIRVDEVRELPKLLAYPPLEMRKRLVVIKEAEALNAQAANAILKILEEPPSHTIFFLLAKNGDALLQTVRSRCQNLRFPPMIESEMVQSLAQEGRQKDKIVAAAHWSEGALERAEELLTIEEVQNSRHLALRCLLMLWRESPRIASECLRIVERFTSEDQVRIAIDSWYTCARDMAVLMSGGNSFPLYHEDSRTELQALATFLQARQNKNTLDTLLREITEKCEKLHRMRVSLDFNVNQKLALDAMVSELPLFSIGKTK